MKITQKTVNQSSEISFLQIHRSRLAVTLLSVLFALSACNNVRIEDNKPSNSAQRIDSTSAPQLGKWGVETQHMDKNVHPGDDFYRYVNKGWLDTTKIPVGLPEINSFVALQLSTEKRIAHIIEEVKDKKAMPGSPEQHVADLYASYIDIEGRNQRGIDMFKGDLNDIMALQTRSAIAARMGRTAYYPLFEIGSETDTGNPNRYILWIQQSGLGLPDRDYYLNKGEPFDSHRKAYIDYIAGVLARAGLANTKHRAKAIFDFESKIAKRHWSKVENRDAVKRYKVMSKAELQAFAPGFDWAAFLKEAGYDSVNTMQVTSNTAIKAMAALFGKTPVPVLRDHLAFSLLNSHATMLSEPWENAHFDMYSRRLQGIANPRPLPERAVQFVSELLGEEVGKLYVDRYFPPAYKAKTEEMVGFIVDAMREHLQKLDWMDEPTHKEALAKLNLFEVMIGYPDKWHDHTGIKLSKDDLIGNAHRYFEWSRKDDRAKLDEPIRRWEWGHNPQEINAYYTPFQNQIVFLAGILQPPFFDPNADPAVNFGSIGVVIGHEIGHGFDDQGRHSDGTGKLREWWTQEALNRFNEKTRKLVAQYNQYSPVSGVHVNGNLTLGENIGDMGGVSLAYTAFQKYAAANYPDGKPPELGGFTGNQRFFLGFTQMWHELMTDDSMRMKVLTDVHSPGEYRANGIVRNFGPWYDAFGVTETNKLYLPKEDRISIW